MDGLLHGLRRFLAWQARVILREEEWVFGASLDLVDLIDAIDARLQRKPAPKGLVIWAAPSRAMSVCVDVSGRIEIFGGGGWTLRPRLLGNMYFAGELTENAVRGRFRQTAFFRAFLLFAINMVLVWLLISLSFFVYQTGGCLIAVGDYCGCVRNAAAVLAGGAAFAVVGYVFIRLFAWVSGLGRSKIRVFLADLTTSGSPA